VTASFETELRPDELGDLAALQDERLLLGVCLQDPEKALDAIALVPAEDLADPRHQALMRLLADRVLHGKSLDYIEVVQAVHAVGPSRFGGAAYVVELPDHAPSTFVDLEALGQRIRERYTRRILATVGHTLLRGARGEPTTFDGAVLPSAPDALAGAVALALSRIAQPAVQVESTLGEALEAAVDQRRTAREQGKPRAVATCVSAVDTILDGGVRAGELVIVAGRPGAGKTAYALGIASDCAEAGGRVGVVSLEMGREELADRLLARAAGTPLARIRTGELDDDENMRQWRAHVGAWNIRIAAPPSASTPQVITQARRWAARGLDLLVIDYLQLMKHGRADRHDLAIGETTSALKQLARDLRVPVLLLSQLNREVDRRSSTKKRVQQDEHWWLDVELPRLSDLRDSGHIESDADVVLFPVRGEQFGIESPSAAALVVAKNRNGRVGVAPLGWHGPTASYGAA
jgi:replicative DNA helicase